MTSPLTKADRAHIIAHLSYELMPVGERPSWDQLAMEIVRLDNEIARLNAALRQAEAPHE